MSKELTVKIAERIREEGGRAYFVGGCVRDELLGQVPKDYDLEVYGIVAEKLPSILEEFGKVDSVGSSFQVYKLEGLDISLPRREQRDRRQRGHRAFIVEGDPFMTFVEACSRRDFTINAIMKDVLTEEIIDPFDGAQDLKDGILRVVSEQTFKEDSLRVLRLAQFHSRFGFFIEEKTVRLAQEVDLSDLPRERIWTEMEKLLMKSEKPSLGLLALVLLGIREKLFPELLLSTKVLGAVDNTKRPYNWTGLKYPQRLSLVLTALLSETREPERFFHRTGLETVENYKVKEQVCVGVNCLKEDFSLYTDVDMHLLSQKIQLRILSRALHAVSNPTRSVFLSQVVALDILDEPIKPVFQGRDLIEMGFKPAKWFGDALYEVFVRQMEGKITSKEEGIDYIKGKLVSYDYNNNR